MVCLNLWSITNEQGKKRLRLYSTLINCSSVVFSWTTLYSSTTVAVVPPRHDGYPRFLSAAWPYYAGAISTSFGFFLFSAIWLAGEVKGAKKHGKAGKTE